MRLATKAGTRILENLPQLIFLDLINNKKGAQIKNKKCGPFIHPFIDSSLPVFLLEFSGGQADGKKSANGGGFFPHGKLWQMVSEVFSDRKC